MVPEEGVFPKCLLRADQNKERGIKDYVSVLSIAVTECFFLHLWM